MTVSRMLFPGTIALALLSFVVCASALWRGVNAQQMQFILTFLVSVNFAVLALVLSIVSRVRALRNDVTRIASGNDLSLRLAEKGDDELSDLSHNINVMLAELEETQEYLVIARDSAEAADRAKSSLLELLRRKDLELSRAKQGTDGEANRNGFSSQKQIS